MEPLIEQSTRERGFTVDRLSTDTSPSARILILDDQESDRRRMGIVCSKLSEPFQFFESSNITEAKHILCSEKIHVMILDRQLAHFPDGRFENGIDYISELLEIQPHLQILVVTGTKEIPEVVRAINLGAANYFVKDSQDDLVRAQIERAISQARVKLREIQFQRTLEKKDVDFVGQSRAIRQLRNRLKGIADSDRPVLLLGESGTGKTTAAKFIHNLRKKVFNARDASFFSLNMGAIPATLAERELFGNERGAFTDAKEIRPGIFELADGGTLFLDEIGEAPLELQAKLLKVLEEGRFRRLGGQQERKSTFKLICATNRDLEKLVTEGKFREDLYMRISTFVVTVPSLQDRSEDVEDLVKTLLPRACTENKIFVDYSALPTEFVEYIKDNPIPGNIRGIEHLLSRLLVLSPKGRNGQPDFSGWKKLLFPRTRTVNSSMQSEIRIPVDPAEGAFSLSELTDRFEDSVVRMLSQRLMRTEDIAKALKVSKATAHRLLLRIGQSDRRKMKGGL